MLFDADKWLEAESAEPELTGPYVLGLDLGGSAAMSAACGYWPVSGALRSIAAFSELPELPERAKSDAAGNLYQRMSQRGELFLAGRHVADVGALLRWCLERWGRPVAIVADRWRSAELRRELEAVGFPFCAHVERGQGYADGSEDVRGFRRGLLNKRVRPYPSLLLRAAMAESRTVSDPAGNAKLAKSSEGNRRGRARDDAAAAAVLAVAEGLRRFPNAQAVATGPVVRHAVA